jgi:uncharacterized protein
MPATDAAMGPPMGSGSSSGGMGSKMTSGWASPAILGLLVFGMITMLLGLLLLPKPYGNGYEAIAGGIFTFGWWIGIALGLIGLMSYLQGHQYWATAFLGYGIFWVAWSYANVTGGYLNSGFGVAGLMFIWLMFTAALLISSFKHGWGTFFSFLFLAIGFILLIVGFWQMGPTLLITKISAGERWAIGGELIFTGLVWWYNGTAQLTEHTYGRRLLPH